MFFNLTFANLISCPASAAPLADAKFLAQKCAGSDTFGIRKSAPPATCSLSLNEAAKWQLPSWETEGEAMLRMSSEIWNEAIFGVIDCETVGVGGCGRDRGTGLSGTKKEVFEHSISIFKISCF